MTSDPSAFDADDPSGSDDPEPPWFQWLNRFVALVRAISSRGLRKTAAGHEPIFRIAQTRDRLWMVERPGAAIEHVFPDIDQAVAFIRHESATPAMVELRIGDLYVVSRFDPRRPSSLFGEAIN